MRTVSAIVLLILGATVILIRRWLVVVTVTGASMLPGLRPGEHVLVVRRNGNRLRVGDVVVFRLPNTADGRTPETGWIIKRVAGLPGDVIVSQQVLPRHEAIVPPGHVYLLGDNSGSSTDSRHFGTVPYGTAVGIVRRKAAIPSFLLRRGSVAGRV